jgi:addiction module RelE/StbE family toxin
MIFWIISTLCGVDVRVDLNKQFSKQYAKLPDRLAKKVKRAIELFAKNPTAPKLRLHELKGKLSGVWSISAGGDLCIHFEYVDKDAILMIAVGTHGQLYK